jgi:aminopeptidase N
MIKSCRFLVFLLFFCTANVDTLAQPEPQMKSIEMIVANEKAAFSKLLKPHEQLIENNYDLKYHRFFLFADPAQTYINGSVTSYFIATQAGMNSIQFELYSTMSADSAFHHGIKQNVSHTGNVISIPLGATIAENTLDSVTVYYHGNPTTSGFGSFGNEIHGGAPGMWTLSEPYGASDWWPSKNDLTDKIDSIDMFVVTPTGNHVASNGLLISETPYGTNSVLAHWKHRYPIVSYLIAIASTNYARFSDYYITGSDSLEILNYVYPEDSALLNYNAKDVLPALQIFEELFTPYPFRAEKYGQAQFGWGGGMEHQTMTFLGKSAFSPEVISHELAHQWFGDMVTCGSWHDIWLNEGFATYCAALRFERTDNNYWNFWKKDNIAKVCSQPGGSVYCDDTTNVGRIFDSRLSYRKGSMVLHQLRWMLGDEVFFEGMRNYLNDPKLQHGFAWSSDFQKHMEVVSGLDLAGYFADWLYGQGYPIYTVNVTQSPDHATSVTIYQSQSHSSVDFFEMPVPIWFLGEAKDTLIVFKNTSSGQNFIANPGFTIDSVVFDPDSWLVSKNNTLTLGRDELLNGRNLVLMPNPANNILVVQHNLGKIISLEIISTEGKSKAIRYENNEEGRIVLDVRNLKPGTYLLRIEYKQGIVTRKFVIQR